MRVTSSTKPTNIARQYAQPETPTCFLTAHTSVTQRIATQPLSSAQHPGKLPPISLRRSPGIETGIVKLLERFPLSGFGLSLQFIHTPSKTSSSTAYFLYCHVSERDITGFQSSLSPRPVRARVCPFRSPSFGGFLLFPRVVIPAHSL